MWNSFTSIWDADFCWGPEIQILFPNQRCNQSGRDCWLQSHGKRTTYKKPTVPLVNWFDPWNLEFHDEPSESKSPQRQELKISDSLQFNMRKNTCSQGNLSCHVSQRRIDWRTTKKNFPRWAKELPPFRMDSKEGMAFEAFTGCTSNQKCRSVIYKENPRAPPQCQPPQEIRPYSGVTH